MDFFNPSSFQSPHVQGYLFDVMSDRELVTMHQLEHPNYETEEEYALIVEAWLKHRDRWTRENRANGEFLPKPKRKLGRPVSKETLERKQREAEEKAVRRAEREARARDREARAAAARVEREERSRAMVSRAKASGVHVITFKMPERILLGITQIRGNLTIADCIVQLLDHALGPLAKDPDAATRSDDQG
jgi:hypothetical protein